MNRHQHSRSSLFLMEIILNILFFIIMVVLCLQLFFKANRLSENTRTLHQAVSVCDSIAQISQSTDSPIPVIVSLFADAGVTGDEISLYYNNAFAPCSKEGASYQAILIPQDTSYKWKVSLIRIDSQQCLYELTFSNYRPASPASTGGASHE